MSLNTERINISYKNTSVVLLSGSSAGVFGTLIGYPLETVKSRLQTQTQYKGILDCTTKIIRNEGINGLYRGIVPPLINLIIINTVAFTVFNSFKTYIGLMFKTDSNKYKSLQYFVAGASTGMFSGIFTTPFEFLKIQLQLDNVQGKKYSGALDLAKKINKRHGSRLLYTGYTINSFRECLFGMCYFGLYENLKLLCSTNEYLKQVNSPFLIPICGGISGAFAWFVSFPLDCIKSNKQGFVIDDKTVKIPKFKEIAKEIWNKQGIKGFYNGVSASIFRAFIVSSTRFSAFEFTKSCLLKLSFFND